MPLARQGLELQPAFPSLTLKRLDVFAFLEAVVADPGSFGLSNAEDSCITPDTIKGAICSHPDRFLFWDGIHPTRVGHQILANEAEKALAE